MDHGVFWVLKRDFEDGWQRWQQPLSRLHLPQSELWRRGLDWASMLAQPRHFAAYTATLCVMGLISGAWALRSGRLEPVLARWFTVISLFVVGFILEQPMQASVSTSTDWQTAFVLLWAGALWPVVPAFGRALLALFVAFVGLAQARAGHDMRALISGVLMALILTLALRAAVRGLWRLSLWRAS